MLIACENKHEIDSLKSKLSLTLEMKDLGPTKRILGINITRSSCNFFLSQQSYIQKSIENIFYVWFQTHIKLSLIDCFLTNEEKKNMSKLPSYNVVGSLMYAMVYTRCDFAYAMSMISRYMSNHGRTRLQAIKWILS